MASGADWKYSGSLLVDMIDVIESTRSGCSMAMVWTIIPPIDAPTTCARSMFSALRSPNASSAIVESV